MNYIILYTLLIIGFTCIFIGYYQKNKHYKWFSKLKQGDKVLVNIYSDNCDCYKEAMIISPPDRKFVEAYMSTDVKHSCKKCINADSSCKYDVTMFKYYTIKKLPE